MLFSSKDKSKQTATRLDTSVFGQFGNLPKPYKEASRKELDKAAILQKLARFESVPEKLLEEAAHIQGQLNRLNMKADKRLELTQAITGVVYPAVAIWYDKFHKLESSLPESHERRNALGMSIQAVEQLANSYKLLFYLDYSSNPSSFAKSRSQLSFYGLRILELIRLIQRLKALRYQQMSKTDWLDVNQAFFSLLLHNAVTESQTLLGMVGVRDKLPKRERAIAPQGSVQDVYSSIQLFGLLETNSWPTTLFHIPDSYLEFLGPDAFRIKPDNHSALQPGFLVTYLKNTKPPLFERQDQIGAPSILFDYSLLYKVLVTDHEAIGKMKFIGTYDLKKLSKPLQQLNDEERIPLLESMLLGLKHRTRQQKRHRVHKPEPLRVYLGREEVSRLLRDLASRDLQKVMDSRQFVDKLARHSSLLAEDDQTHLGTQWSMLNFSASGILIGTEETAFSTPIKIGQLVAFSPADAELQQNTLAYINRLHRTEDNRVEVALVRLSTHAEAVVIQTETDLQEKAGHTATLVKDMYGHWQLLVTPGLTIRSGDPLKLIRSDGSRIPVRIGDVWLTKKEFTMYELRSPGLKE